jgi:hypothetical protein
VALRIVQARLHARARSTSQQDVSDPDDSVGLERLQRGIFAAGDVQAFEKENQPKRLPFHNHDMAA